MAKKAICIIRTSTDKQEIMSQRKEVLSMALADGYAEDDIIVIGKQGASAIKLDDAYMENLRLFYETAEREDVGCVYCWALDRVGRKERILMEFKEFLLEHKLQFKIKTPSLTLLNDDGSVNAGIELAISLFATLAKQEMEQKLARFRRAKQRNREVGRYQGGRVLFGYKVNKDGFFEPHETNAGIVRSLFREYAEGNLSTLGLAQRYPEIGLKENSPLSVRRVYIMRILKHREYLGERHFPRLIDEETFNKAQEKFKEFRARPKISYQRNVYFLHGLLCVYIDQPDGTKSRYILSPVRSKNVYFERKTGASISINVADTLAVMLLRRHLDKIRPAIRTQLERSLAVAKTEIADIEREISEVSARFDELTDKYFAEGTIGRQTYDRLTGKLKLRLAELQSLREEHRADIEIMMENAREANETLWLDENAQRDLCASLISEVVVSTKTNGLQTVRFTFKGILAGVEETGVYDRFRKTWNGEKFVLLRHLESAEQLIRNGHVCYVNPEKNPDK